MKNISAEQSFSEMAANMAPDPEKEIQPDKPVVILKRIGSTTYQVAVHFSTTSKETMDEKITRMIKNERLV